MAPSACANCGAPLGGEYCARCGQRAVKPNPTVSEFLHDTTRELLNWDGKIPQTLKTLFVAPGQLTVDFLTGRRARWLSPLRVYLICSIAFFAARPLVEAITGRSPRQIARLTIDNPSGTLTPEDREAIRAGLPARILGPDQIERAMADPVRFNREFDAALPRAMFILLPVFALLTNLAWRRVQPRYPAHLYVALHFNAAVFGGLTAFVIVVGFVRLDVVAFIGLVLLQIYLAWYAIAAFHRIFGEPWPKTITKAILVGIAYYLCVTITAFGFLAYAITRM